MEECNNHKKLARVHGDTRAKRIRRRLDQLRAASVFQDLFTLPQGRCHPLTGNRAGTFSLDLDGPYRLYLRPCNEPLPEKEDGSIDLSKVTHIEILGIEDPHDKKRPKSI